MVKSRIPETDNGIQGEFNVEIYDQMMSRLRDKGFMETDEIIKFGINKGFVLEIGPGPGYLGLEWLSKTQGTKLQGIEISRDMINMARRNSKEYELENRVEYVKGDAQDMPFDNNIFDGVFSNGSLHEWSQPIKIFNEIHRVLKPGGRYFISDMKRDMNFLGKWFLKLNTKPKEMRAGLISSINAGYTVTEIVNILEKSNLKDFSINEVFIGFEITGKKE